MGICAFLSYGKLSNGVEPLYLEYMKLDRLRK